MRIILYSFLVLLQIIILAQEPTSFSGIEKANWAWSAGYQKNIQAIPELCHLTINESWMIRCAAVNALGNFADLETAGTLSIGSEANFIGQTILRRLSDEHYHVRTSAARQIGKFPLIMPLGLVNLQRILQKENENEAVRIAAAESLGMLGDPSSIPVFQEVWTKSYHSSHGRLLQSIEASLEKIAIFHGKKLLEVLQDTNQPLEWRRQIILTFGRLLFLLQEKGEEFTELKESLDELRPMLPDFILSMKYASDLEETIAEFRSVALMLYIDLGLEQSIPMLKQLTQDKQILVQKIAILGLGKLKQEDALPIFFEKMKQTYHPNIMDSALWAITQFPAEIIQENILRAMKESSSQISAIRLVAHFGIVEASPILLDLYQQNEALRPSIVGTFDILQNKMPADHPDYAKIQEILQKYKLEKN